MLPLSIISCDARVEGNELYSVTSQIPCLLRVSSSPEREVTPSPFHRTKWIRFTDWAYMFAEWNTSTKSLQTNSPTMTSTICFSLAIATRALLTLFKIVHFRLANHWTTLEKGSVNYVSYLITFYEPFYGRYYLICLEESPVACRGGRTGRRPRASKARGASKEWNYKKWNAVTGWFFLL